MDVRLMMTAKAGKANSLLKLLQFPDGKTGAVAVLELLIQTGDLAAAWELPPIVRVERGFPLPPDFMLYHDDHSVSIVEVPDAGNDRDVLGSLHRLSLYSMPLKTVIRRILAA